MPCDPDQQHTINRKTWEIELIISALESERNAFVRYLHTVKDKTTKDNTRKEIEVYALLVGDLMNVLDQACLDKKD